MAGFFCFTSYVIKGMVMKLLGDSPLEALTAFTIGSINPSTPVPINVSMPSPNNRIAGILKTM